MITEDYVSFETAKLLKEKGFDGECDLFGRTDEPELIIREAAKIAYNQGIDDECVIIPTLQMAMKWLREVHHIFIRVIQSHIEYCACEIYYNRVSHYEFRESFNSYEEAAEAAIMYCLKNLI